METISDEELMAMFQQGSHAAFDILFDRYRTPVFNFVYRMVGRRREVAEDLLQEVFMKVYHSRDTFRTRLSFAGWLFRIARNHCLNHLNSRLHVQDRTTVSLESSAEPSTDNPETASEHQPAMEMQHQAMNLLEQAIGKLPDKYREVFLLHAVEGLSHVEIAAMLETKPATIRTHYHRARIMLRDKIGPVLAT